MYTALAFDGSARKPVAVPLPSPPGELVVCAHVSPPSVERYMFAPAAARRVVGVVPRVTGKEAGRSTAGDEIGSQRRPAFVVRNSPTPPTSAKSVLSSAGSTASLAISGKPNSTDGVGRPVLRFVQVTPPSAERRTVPSSVAR